MIGSLASKFRDYIPNGTGTSVGSHEPSVDEPFEVKAVSDHNGLIVGEAHLSLIDGRVTGVTTKPLAFTDPRFVIHSYNNLPQYSPGKNSLYPIDTESVNNAVT